MDPQEEYLPGGLQASTGEVQVRPKLWACSQALEQAEQAQQELHRQWVRQGQQVQAQRAVRVPEPGRAPLKAQQAQLVQPVEQLFQVLEPEPARV